MLAVDRAVENAPCPPRHRHGIPSPSINDASLSWEKPPTSKDDAQGALVTKSGAYPSPPMSGSPPILPAPTAQALISSATSPPQSTLSDTSHTKWSSDKQQHHSHQSDPSLMRWAVEQQQRQSAISRTTSSPQHQPPITTTPSRSPLTRSDPPYQDSHEHTLPPLITTNASQSTRNFRTNPRQPYASPAPSLTHNHSASHIRASSLPDPHSLSPKSQRKTKGHVASACVPCKKAHLRCDAQRPCSRCVTHGKEDACVDVQHKKRGRPRLKDDRDSRMETASRFAAARARAHEMNAAAAAKRSTNLRPASIPRPAFYGNTSRRAAVSAATPPPPLLTEEPLIYMRTTMEVVKVSPSFSEAVGSSASNFIGRKLMDMVTPEAFDTMMELCGTLSAEQKRREPNYLPPIFDRGDDAIRALAFSPESVARLDFTHQAFVAFRSHGGPPRSFPVHLALFKQGSFFFVAAHLRLGSRPTARQQQQHHPHHSRHPHQQQQPPRRPPPSTSAHPPSSRNLRLTTRAAVQNNSPTELSPRDVSMMDVDVTHRRFAVSQQQQQQRREPAMAASQKIVSSPGSTHRSIYSPSPHTAHRHQDHLDPDQLSPRQQTPRSEGKALPPRLGRSPGTSGTQAQYTLPPIRLLGKRAGQALDNDDKQKRVTIGGLINRPGS